jgi:hypothetical protein
VLFAPSARRSRMRIEAARQRRIRKATTGQPASPTKKSYVRSFSAVGQKICP